MEPNETLQVILRKTLFLLQNVWPYSDSDISLRVVMDKHDRMEVELIVGDDYTTLTVMEGMEHALDMRSDEDILFRATLDYLSDYMKRSYEW
tara:strand:- start:2449 stop:2724 length:276 start_codon:yes stop_codon:yes gene_type:complete